MFNDPDQPIAPDEYAATVVLLRDAPQGMELLMLRRNSKLNFAGGLWVFPGGRIDPSDYEGLSPSDEPGAARVCAAREAAEESALTLAPEDLIPLSHWTPPDNSPRRFLTWFFLGRAPAGEVTIDQGEIHDHRWVSATEGIRKVQQDTIQVLPPTIVTLTALAEYTSVEQALDKVREAPVDYFRTRISMGAEGPIALWQGDAGYEEKDASKLGARHRLLMAPGGWKYERDPQRED